MKLQIAFDFLDLNKALDKAGEVQEYADILEVGSLLILKYGQQAVQAFKEHFPHKTILADTKIVDRGKEAVSIFAQVGADWVTVMSGTSRNVIHSVTQTAHEAGKRVMLDLLDASSLGQSALEAKSLGADALLFHSPELADARVTLLERWDMVKGNTTLPIYIAASATRDTIAELIAIKPYGLVLSSTITQAEDSKEEAAFYHTLLNEAK